jgi:hypothetical protein
LKSTTKLFTLVLASFLFTLIAIFSFNQPQLASALAPTETPISTPEVIPPLNTAGDLTVVYEVEGMSDVNITPDVIYLLHPKNTIGSMSICPKANIRGRLC